MACVESESTCISVGVLSSFHPFLCPPVFIFGRLMASFLLDINLSTKKNKKATVFSCQFCSRTDRLIWPRDQSHPGINGNSCQCAYLVIILTMTYSVNFKFYFYLISSYKSWSDSLWNGPSLRGRFAKDVNFPRSLKLPALTDPCPRSVTLVIHLLKVASVWSVLHLGWPGLLSRMMTSIHKPSRCGSCGWEPLWQTSRVQRCSTHAWTVRKHYGTPWRRANIFNSHVNVTLLSWHLCLKF